MDEFKQDFALVKQDLALVKQDLALVKQDLALVKQDFALVKQDVKLLGERVSALESAFDEYRHETSAQLDRIEGHFGHLSKKWMEHDEEISRLKRRNG